MAYLDKTIVTNDESTASSFYVPFATATSGPIDLKTDSGFYYNPNTKTLRVDKLDVITQTWLESETVTIADNLVQLNSNATGVPSEDSGLEVNRGSSANVLMKWNESTDRWQFTNDGTTYYNIPISTEYNINNDHGTVTSVATGTGLTGGTITGSGTISLAAAYGDSINPYASKTAKYVLAAPNGADGVPTFRALVASDIPTLNQNTTGTAANVTGTVAIANGGTGAGTAQAAINALAGAVTSGQYLRGNGTNVVMSAIQAADVPTLNQNTTGTAATVTGATQASITTCANLVSVGTITTGTWSATTIAVTKGGTGTTTAPTQGGIIYGSSTSAYGSTGVGTQNQLLVSNAASAPTWNTIDLTYMPDAAYKKSVKAATTTNITLSAPQTIDTVSVVAGDRVLVKNQSAPAENGIYVVQAAAWTRATDADTISKIAGATVNIDAGSQGGILWSNNLKTSDTLGTTAMPWYKLISTNDTANWDTAYTDRNKWDGGSSGLTAATGRTSLGATTVGSNMFTLANPSAITFLRVNADNTVSTLDAATFRTAIGAGTSSTSGTVTSIASGNGMNFTTITGTGPVTLGTPTGLTATTTDAVTATSHTHSIATAAAVSQSNATTNGVGTSTSLARADHTHAITGFALTAHSHGSSEVSAITYAVAATALTGASTAPSNGQLLIGDGTDYTRATLTAGQGIKVTNGAGSITIAQSETVVTKTAAYTMTATDSICLADATSASFVITLPAVASSAGIMYNIKKIDSSANTVTIDGNAAELIDGAANTVLGFQFQSISLICDGSAWYIL